MLLATIFRVIRPPRCARPSETLPGDASGSRTDRPTATPRWKPVRGAASEPYCAEAGFNSAGDGKAEIAVA
jgi:hypothetical protein